MKENTIVTNGIRFNSSFRQQNPKIWALSPIRQSQKKQINFKDNSTRQMHSNTEEDKVSYKQIKKLGKHKARNISMQSNEKFLKNLQQFPSTLLNEVPTFKKEQGIGLRNHEEQEVPTIFKEKRCPTSIQIQIIKQCELEEETQQLKKTFSKRRVNYESSKLPTLNLNKNQLKQEQKNKKRKQLLNLKYYLKEKELSLVEMERKFSTSFSLLSRTNEKQIKQEKSEIKRLQQNFKNIYLDKTFLETRIHKTKLKQKLLKREIRKQKRQVNRERKHNNKVIAEGLEQMKIISNKKLLLSKSNDVYKNEYRELLTNFLEKQRMKTYYVKTIQHSRDQFDFEQ